MMRPERITNRKLMAALCVAGAMVPAIVAAVFIATCCVLPFHRLVHSVVPLCQSAAEMLAGDHHGGAHHEGAPATPAREKEEVRARVPVEPISPLRVSEAAHGSAPLTLRSATAYRSYISLGALRCDQDVGLHVLVETFLI